MRHKKSLRLIEEKEGHTQVNVCNFLNIDNLRVRDPQKLLLSQYILYFV